MATSNKSKKILEKARKIAAKTKKKKVSKVDVKKKTTSYPEGQNAPQSKKYTQESDKALSAKSTGWRWTKEGAKKLGKSVESKPTTSDIEKYRNETFKLKGKPNKSGPKGVGDGSHRYLYVERRADKADITRKNKLMDGGETKKAWGVFYNNELVFRESSQEDALKSAKMLKSEVSMPFGVSVEKIDNDEMAKGGKVEDLRKRFEGYTDEELQIFNGDNKETLKNWNRKDAIEDAINSVLDEDDGDEMAKGGKIPSSEVTYFKKYVKEFYGKDEMYSEFFPPLGASNDEINLAVSQYIEYCKTKDDQWGGGDSFDREIVRDIMFYNRGTRKGLEYQRAIKEIFGKDKKEYGGILQPMIGGVNADPRFDIYNTTMFAKKGAELPKGEYRRGGFVTTLDDAIATDELKGEASSKMGEDDSILNFAYTDYGGDFFDIVAIDYFLENYPENIVVENTGWGGRNAIVFGAPAQEFIEASESYLLGFDNIEEYYYQRQYEQEREDFERFLEDIQKYQSYKVSDEAMDWLMENRTGYFNITTTGVDFSESDLINDLENEGLIEKETDDYAKGGKTKKASKTPKVDNGDLVRYAQTNDQLKVLKDIIPVLDEKGIKLKYGTSVGKQPQTIIFDKNYHDGILRISSSGWYGENTYNGEEFGSADDLEYVIDNPSEDDYAKGGTVKPRVVPIYIYELSYSKHGKEGTFVDKVKAKSEDDAINKWVDQTNRSKGGVYTIIDVVKSSRNRMEDGGEMAHGGSTHEQGYDDREDESLAMRHGKIASKDFVGSHARREHSRRDDARFEERHKKAYGGLTDSSIELLD